MQDDHSDVEEWLQRINLRTDEDIIEGLDDEKDSVGCKNICDTFTNLKSICSSSNASAIVKELKQSLLTNYQKEESEHSLINHVEAFKGVDLHKTVNLKPPSDVSILATHRCVNKPTQENRKKKAKIKTTKAWKTCDPQSLHLNSKAKFIVSSGPKADGGLKKRAQEIENSRKARNIIQSEEYKKKVAEKQKSTRKRLAVERMHIRRKNKEVNIARKSVKVIDGDKKREKEKGLLNEDVNKKAVRAYTEVEFDTMPLNLAKKEVINIISTALHAKNEETDIPTMSTAIILESSTLYSSCHESGEDESESSILPYVKNEESQNYLKNQINTDVCVINSPYCGQDQDTENSHKSSILNEKECIRALCSDVICTEQINQTLDKHSRINGYSSPLKIEDIDFSLQAFIKNDNLQVDLKKSSVTTNLEEFEIIKDCDSLNESDEKQECGIRLAEEVNTLQNNILVMDSGIQDTINNIQTPELKDVTLSKKETFSNNHFTNIYPNFQSIFTLFSNSLSSFNDHRFRICLQYQVDLYNEFQHNLVKNYEVKVDDPTNREEFDSKSLLYKIDSARPETSSIISDTFQDENFYKTWRESCMISTTRNFWNLLWSFSIPKINPEHLLVCQRISRFQNAKFLTSKAYLKKKINNASFLNSAKDAEENIMLLTFVLPTEYNAFVNAFSSTQKTLKNNSNIWIMKPIGMSRGRGIHIINDIGNVSYAVPTIIQRYLLNPLLFRGFKFDFRIYVLVTSFSPLEAFIHQEGFARFCSKAFSLNPAHLNDPQRHLTNSSIQKKYWGKDINSAHPAQLAGSDGGCNKVRIKWLLKRLKDEGLDTETIWRKMCDLCLKTLLCVEDDIPNQPNAFEVFGFDVIVSDNLKPLLIEVNSSPSMTRETYIDTQVKDAVIKDTISLLNPSVLDRKSLAKICERRLCKKKTVKCVLSEKDQLEKDFRDIFSNIFPRQYGEPPKKLGGYERLAPGTKLFDHIKHQRDRTKFVYEN